MKFHYLCVLILITFSCSQDDTYFGEVSALKNGQNWNGKIYSSFNKPLGLGIDINIDKFDEFDVLSENLFFFKVPRSVGLYKLSRTLVRNDDDLIGVKLFEIIDGDAIGNSFQTRENNSDQDYIEITKVENDNSIEGNFKMTLIKTIDTIDGIPSIPDTILFTQGKFSTKIRN